MDMAIRDGDVGMVTFTPNGPQIHPSLMFVTHKFSNINLELGWPFLCCKMHGPC